MRAAASGRRAARGRVEVNGLETLVIILLLVLVGVILMVEWGEKLAKPMNSEQLGRITRWILPLVGLSILIQLVRHLLQ